MRILILSIVLISLSACKSTKENSSTEKEVTQEVTIEEFNLPTSEYVILPFDSTITWYHLFDGAQKTDLSNLELNEIEKIIETAIQENNLQQNDQLIQHNKSYPDNQLTETGYELKLEGFKRQYVPVINSKGEKEIWVNFFCSDWNTEKWKSGIFMVHDGGNCDFNLKVNLTTHTYRELIINGYA